MIDKDSRTMDIGQKILEIRKAEGLSQTEFAEKFHVTRQTVSNWEHGKNYPDMETLMRISDEYSITFDELIKNDRELIRSIDRSRRVARKSVIAFSAIGVILIAALLIKLMPGLVSKFYYDPKQTVAVYTDKDGYLVGTSRLETDARVYGELYLPEKRYDLVDVEDLGFGEYAFTLSRSLYSESEWEPQEISGRIERNRFLLYEPSLYRRPEWDPAWSGESKKDIQSYIETLDENRDYISYITFNDTISYKDACKWSEENNGSFHWAGIITDKNDCDMMGFYIVPSGNTSAFDTEKYPYLFGYANPEPDDIFAEPLYDEEIAKKHFVSMMKYLADNPEYTAMLWGRDMIPDNGKYTSEMNKKISYVENYGLQVYGIALEASKADLLAILSDKNVSNIEIEAF